jgi:transporter family protein
VWVLYAVLSAVFAAFTSILAKIGIEGVNSNLAVAIRTAVVLFMSWGIAFFMGEQRGIAESRSEWWVVWGGSGAATGLSWLCYYKALQTGDASKVIPIDKLSVVISMVLAFAVLGEKADIKTVIGGALIAVGAVVLAL